MSVPEMSTPAAARSSEGGNFGSLSFEDNKNVIMTAPISKLAILQVSLDNVAQCVVPTNNRNDLEIQYHESDTRKDEDCLVQMTFHFPKILGPEGDDDDDDDDDDEEDADKDTHAEAFQKLIVDTGVIDSTTGNVLVEFAKEEGSFVSPRGRYSVQVILQSHPIPSGS